jgi:hypothetical protein
MPKTYHHIQHYLPLLGILGAGVAGFIMFSYDNNFQFVIAVAMSLGYVSWGIVHHYLHKDIYLEVVLEYALIALLGLVLIFTVIFRA